ncbi:MAG: thioesterase family protein [Pseudomonadota bacterium]|jgi:acyl-CoA thioester hydrolase|nr:thioesterase family protein [Pseudomonadota bacterium]
MSKENIETRDRYPHFLSIQTRWSDNDIYGHVNNVTYYSYFDTVVNCFLIDQGGLDIETDSVIGMAVETMCKFNKPLAYPEVLEAGLRVGKLGNSSVRYEIGIFQEGAAEAAAMGHFVHVFVDRATGKPAPIPDAIRSALERIKV